MRGLIGPQPILFGIIHNDPDVTAPDKLRYDACAVVGPYNNEETSIEEMQSFAKENGLSFHGKHHRIYLSDPRRVAQEKLRTILRCPVK